MNSESENSNPSDIENAASSAISLLIPTKSKDKYESTYKIFQKWCDEKKVTNINEKVLLAYFQIKSASYKSSSLWTFYSMLRTMISTRNNIDISKFTNLIALLKRKSEGYKAKKSKVLLKNDFEKFLKEADESNHLLLKVKS